jgi:protein ImuB
MAHSKEEPSMKYTKQHAPIFLCIYFPMLAIERYQITASANDQEKNPASPIALCHHHNGQSLVACCCSKARAAQITSGMSTAFARTRLANLTIGRFSPNGDYKLLESFAASLADISPCVGIDTEAVQAHKNGTLQTLALRYYGLIVDVRGTERLHGNLSQLINSIAKRFNDKGYTCRIGRGATISSAWACSRFHPLTISEYQPNDNSILPAKSLRISAKLAQELSAFGLSTIEHVMGISIKELSVRFDRALITRIDQFRGATIEQITLYTKPSAQTLRRAFEPALERHEQIVKAYAQTTSALYELLTKKSVYAESFHASIECLLEGGARTTLAQSFSFYRPTYSAEHLCQVVSQHFEAGKLPGALCYITLTAHGTKPIHHEQLGMGRTCSDTAELDTREVDALFNSLLLTVGGKGVRTLHFLNSYLPEKAFSFIPVVSEPRPHYNRTVKNLPAHAAPPGERPTYLLNTPILIEATALMPDHPPARIVWNKKHYRLLRGRGPERIDIDWWNKADQQSVEQREYFSVQEPSGRWLWIYRLIPSQQWYLHGVWC